MKKFLSLLLIVCMMALVLCSCGVKVEDLDPAKYITLGNYTEFDINQLKEDYVKAREENAEDYTSFNVDWGYTITFNMVCEIVTSDSNSKTYTRYEDYCHEGVDTVTLNIYEDTKNAYRADFDSALVYEVTRAGDFGQDASVRKITIGTAFDFEYIMPYMEDNKVLSGKTVRFTITPVKVIPPLYDDLYIVDECETYFENNPTTSDVVRDGDIVTATITGTIDGEAYDGNRYKDLTFTVGCSPFGQDFDEAIIGTTLKTQKVITVTYPEDWTDSVTAGKTVDYAVTFTNAYSYDAVLAEKTEYKTLYEFKEALRFKLYLISNIMSLVYDDVTVIETPKSLYNEYYKTIKAQTDEYLIDDYIYYMNYNGTSCTRDEAITDLFGSKDEYNTYLDEEAKESVRDVLTCYALAAKLNLTLDDDAYTKALDDFTEAYNEDYSQNYSSTQLENKFGRNYLKLIFMENIVANKIVDNLGVVKY